ncbi:MAG: nucleotidyltransferase domain-containing protein [Candidatus Eremiobacteraeota bacterium]|nr:nucleotidyltransferase domain-containing protein [Candidatus Eremiobacteraeota bacterium]
MDSTIDPVLKELKKSFRDLYGERMTHMILYGSRARGDEESGSDINILVVLDGTVSPSEEVTRTGEIVSRLSLLSEHVISCVFMDRDRFHHRNGPLLRNIRKEGITL